jgi:hypothetical protein
MMLAPHLIPVPRSLHLRGARRQSGCADQARKSRLSALGITALLEASSHIANVKPARGVGARVARAWVGLAAAGGLSACAALPPPQDKVATAIAQYYAKNASEEEGQCRSPELASVTKRKVLASSGDSTRLKVRYSYFDPSAPGATDWTRVFQTERACTGFAEREFTLVRGPLGYQVVEMSGPAREQP